MANLVALDLIFGIQHRNDIQNNLIFYSASKKKLFPIPVDNGTFNFPSTKELAYKEIISEWKTISLYKKWLTVKVNQKLVFKTLENMIYNDNIFTKIKNDIIQAIQIYTPMIHSSRDFSTSHPFTNGTFGHRDYLFGTFHHYFNGDEFKDESLLNLAAINSREKILKRLIKKPLRAQHPTTLTKNKTTCLIEKSNNILNSLLKKCKTSTVFNSPFITVKGLEKLIIKDSNLNSVDYKKFSLSNIKEIIFKNVTLSNITLDFNLINKLSIQNTLRYRIVG